MGIEQDVRRAFARRFPESITGDDRPNNQVILPAPTPQSGMSAQTEPRPGMGIEGYVRRAIDFHFPAKEQESVTGNDNPGFLSPGMVCMPTPVGSGCGEQSSQAQGPVPDGSDSQHAQMATQSAPLSVHEHSGGVMGLLNPGDYYTSQMTQTKCGKIPPAPPGVNINSNIYEAAQQWNPTWFYNHVRKIGPWNYKRQNPLYEDFGNFNYGATGSAFGFPDQILLRAAGAASQLASSDRQDLGKPWGNPPYGDDPNDQTQIRKGMEYYQCLQK
jgi:hypothetical protein